MYIGRGRMVVGFITTYATTKVVSSNLADAEVCLMQPYVVKFVSDFGIFWKIIKLFFQKMSAWEDIKAIAEVALMIIVGFATDGLALISKIVLIVDMR
jgi:hypothetical protein